MSRVVVLGGGPDAERSISLQSAEAVRTALVEAGHDTRLIEIDGDRVDAHTIGDAEAIFPALHGPWGEGGGLQTRLDAIGLPYVGCRSTAAALCMDKLATKLLAAGLGIPTARAAVVPIEHSPCPLAFPVVVKPVREGSSVGLAFCDTYAEWMAASTEAARANRTSMVEAWLVGRELTVGLVRLDPGSAELIAMPIVEVSPSDGAYDFAAKYERGDTRYTVAPELPQGVAGQAASAAIALAEAAGVRHLARADFILDEDGKAWFLEINTMPGFTATSLLPMSANHVGIPLAELCDRLVAAAIMDAEAER